MSSQAVAKRPPRFTSGGLFVCVENRIESGYTMVRKAVAQMDRALVNVIRYPEAD
jgi:hypothetical protein